MSDGRHRTSHGEFLTQADWNAAGLRNEGVGREPRRMKPLRGEVTYFLLDDHRFSKRGRKMHVLSKIRDHQDQRLAQGHIVMTAADLIAAFEPPVGLKVRCEPDTKRHPNKVRINNAQMAKNRLAPDAFHGHWNYSIRPG